MNKVIEMKSKIDTVNMYMKKGIDVGMEFEAFKCIATGIEFHYINRCGKDFVKLYPINRNGYIVKDGIDICLIVEIDIESLIVDCYVEKDGDFFNYNIRVICVNRKDDGVSGGIVISSRFKEYKKYLSTAYWDNIKSSAMDRARFKCQLCGSGGVELHTHHNNYDNLCSECESDLIVLCKDCHSKFHNK